MWQLWEVQNASRCFGVRIVHYQIFWVVVGTTRFSELVVGLERGPLNLMRSIEELLE